MKKLLSIVLVLCFVFCFTACGKSEEDNSSLIDRGEEIKTLMLNGQIPEVEHKLGDEPSKIRKYYEDKISAIESEHTEGGHIHSDSDITFSEQEGNRSVTMNAGNLRLFYEKEKANKGISVICSFVDTYGFKVGQATKYEIEEALSSLNGKTVTATEDDLYFLSVAESATLLRFEEGDIRLDFYFNENVLMATVLMNTKNWTL